MSVKFKINKLGPIVNSEIEFKPFMIFTGNSSMGKSYSSFLIYYLMNYLTSSKISEFVSEKLDTRNFETRINNNEKIILNISTKDLIRKINYDSSKFIAYLIGDNSFVADIEVSLPIEDFILEFQKSDTDKSILDEEPIINVELGEYRHRFPYSLLNRYETIITLYIKQHLINKIFNKTANLNSIFLPPSRASLIGANFSVMEKTVASAGMYTEFIKDMEKIMAPSPENFYLEKGILNSFKEILGGEIINEKGSLYYQFNEDRIPITAAASSIKELSPLFLLLNKYKPEDISVLFEEPEAHIHPQMQISIANLLCKLVGKGAFFQITTHSDYFLNQVNNCIRLFNVKRKLKNEFKTFCKKNKLNENNILDPDKLGAYYFERREDGSVQIIKQDVVNGIPFNTFEKSVDDIMRESAIIEDILESEE